MTINGKNFDTIVSVLFNGIEYYNFTVVNDNIVSIMVPSNTGQDGVVDVSIKGSGGMSNIVLFTYALQPMI